MLNFRHATPAVLAAAFGIAAAAPATAQDFAPHRAVYSVTTMDKGKPSGDAPGTYAFELKLTCDGYIVHQRLRLETAGARGSIAFGRWKCTAAACARAHGHCVRRV